MSGSIILYIDGRTPFHAKEEDIQLARDYLNMTQGNRMKASSALITDDGGLRGERPRTYETSQWCSIIHEAERRNKAGV